MKVIRHYYICDDLDELERIKLSLTDRGIDDVQTHVLSQDDRATEHHLGLRDVTSLMKRDVIRSGELGLGAGLIGAALVLALAYFSGATQNPAGWIPWAFLAIVILGFCTWEGGFIGIQRVNKNFVRFEDALNHGRHVFFVDVTEAQTGVLEQVMATHDSLDFAGTEAGTHRWIMDGQKHIPHFLRETMP